MPYLLVFNDRTVLYVVEVACDPLCTPICVDEVVDAVALCSDGSLLAAGLRSAAMHVRASYCYLQYCLWILCVQYYYIWHSTFETSSPHLKYVSMQVTLGWDLFLSSVTRCASHISPRVCTTHCLTGRPPLEIIPHCHSNGEITVQTWSKV